MSPFVGVGNLSYECVAPGCVKRLNSSLGELEACEPPIPPLFECTNTGTGCCTCGGVTFTGETLDRLFGEGVEGEAVDWCCFDDDEDDELLLELEDLVCFLAADDDDEPVVPVDEDCFTFEESLELLAESDDEDEDDEDVVSLFFFVSDDPVVELLD